MDQDSDKKRQVRPLAVNRSVIRGVGAYLPKRVMTNADLAKIVDTNDEWIVERSGIHARHIAAEGELTSDLGIAAAKQALVRAAIDPVDIDLVICSTATPDRTFPATAVTIQRGLGVTKGAAFDVQAVCSGFVFALTVADNFLKAGQFKRAVVVGAETFSRILDWTDRSTCVPLSDECRRSRMMTVSPAHRVRDWPKSPPAPTQPTPGFRCAAIPPFARPPLRGRRASMFCLPFFLRLPVFVSVLANATGGGDDGQ